MRKLICGASVTLALLAAGCAAKPRAGATAAASAAAPDPSRKDIVHIVSRDRTVTVTSSSRGLLYSLKDAAGRVQIADATEQKFAELEPELYRNIKHYIAVHNDDAPIPSAERDQPVPWSGMDTPSPSINDRPRTFRGGGGTSGANIDQFDRTADRPFPTAREDAPE